MRQKKSRNLLLLAFLNFLIVFESNAQSELSPRQIARKTLPSVVLILCAGADEVVLGSGFFIKPGVVVTNYHVVEGMTKGLVQSSIGMKDEKAAFRIARIIAFDKNADIALLSVPSARNAGFPDLNLALSTYRAEVGESVYAFGNPEGLIGTMSPGIISAGLRTFKNKQRIQITAPISEGSSGGPVVNGVGNVIGIAVSTLSEGQNLNFAVPVSNLHSLIRSANFPNDWQNNMDAIADRDDTLRPWSGPLVRRVGTNEGTVVGIGTQSAIGQTPVVRATQLTAIEWFFRGERNVRLGLFEEAISDYSKAIGLSPRLAIAYAHRGRVYLKQQKLDLAIVDFGKSIQHNPKDFEAFNNRGNAYFLQGKSDLAIADYSAAIRLSPQISAFFRNRGSTYRDQGKLDLAIADFTRAIQLEPQNRYPHLLRANVFFRQNKFELAIADYTVAIEIDPQYSEAYLMRASALAGLGKHVAALSDFERAIQLNPNSSEAYYNRGLTYHEQKNLDMAIADYTMAIQLNPRLEGPYTSRGRAYDGQGQHERAIADYGKSLELNPKNAEIYVARSWAKLYVNDGEGAYRDASIYLKLNGPTGELAPYTILVGYLGLRKSARDSDANAFLNDWVKTVPANAWTTEIMRYFLNLQTEQRLLAKAMDDAKLTEAHAYIGEVQLLNGSRDAALAHFRWVKDNGNKDFTEYTLSLAELKRLQ